MKNIDAKLKIEKIRHSLAHLLAAAVLRKFPGAKLGIGPTIEDGFYYDFLFPRNVKFGDNDLKTIEAEIKSFIKSKLTFKGKKITAQEARKIFKDQPFKLDLIKEFVKEKKTLMTYKTGDVFLDLCRGGHVKNSSEINPDAFKLTKIAGAYWHGDEGNPMLTRIYGVAFNSKKELGKYLKVMEEVERRDHKKLGNNLDLFTFSELVGAGLPLWTPKGAVIRDELDSFVWELRKKHGYERVDIPHLAKKELYEISGHWEKFQDELFKIKTREGHLFVVKPMNCPHHIQIYKRRTWSYRDLPQRYASTTKVYRDEQSGELAGLARVRAITQDDAHVFCRKSQMEDEVEKIWDIIETFYKTTGFNLKIRLSLCDSRHPQKYLGTSKSWSETESRLRNILKKHKVKFIEAKGEAAFYGPKIDFLTKDSLNREWQVATIQVDMNMPERFDLTCINEKGERERIAMIHAAIMGAIERYIAVLIEHFAGAFPLWLAPVQARVLAVSQKHQKHAESVSSVLRKNKIKVELTDFGETLGKRIREAELQKIPYILVVGDKELKNKSVNVRHYRRGQEGEVKLEKLIQKIQKEIERKTI